MATNKKEKMLLHCCCAPCTAYVVELLGHRYELTLFFYNPNIHPEYEYKKRLAELKNFSLKKGLKLITGEYAVNEWLKKTDGHEKDPERGERCKICYFERLEKTAMLAKEERFDMWGTTLTISPYKSDKIINFLGNELEDKHGVQFLKANFKEQGGFQKSLELSKRHNFYRQNYCGCLFSQIARLNRPKK